MKNMLSDPDIYLYRESVDFRKSINGLAAIIKNDPNLPLGSGALFLFNNKNFNKIKVLYWDKTGFTLWYSASKKPSTSGLNSFAIWTMVTYLSTIIALNVQLNHWSLAVRAGYSLTHQAVLIREQCFTASSRSRKPTVLSSTTTWSNA